MNVATLNRADVFRFPQVESQKGYVDPNEYRGIYQSNSLGERSQPTQYSDSQKIPNTNGVIKNNIVNFRYENKTTLREKMESAIAQINDLAAKEIMLNYIQSVLKIQELTAHKSQQELFVNNFTIDLLNSIAELCVLPKTDAFVNSLKPQLSAPIFDIISTHFEISFNTAEAIASSIEQIYGILGYDLTSLQL